MTSVLPFSTKAYPIIPAWQVVIVEAARGKRERGYVLDHRGNVLSGCNTLLFSGQLDKLRTDGG
jgi:hypothetical protein